MKQILFLCSGNYYRSRFAEEMFNHKAQGAGKDWLAVSRGIALNPRNAGPIARVVLARLAELGIAPRNAERFPIPAEAADLEAADRIIALSRKEHHPIMSQKFPAHADVTEYWEVEDTWDMPHEEALARITEMVEGLVERVG